MNTATSKLILAGCVAIALPMIVAIGALLLSKVIEVAVRVASFIASKLEPLR